MLCNVTYVCLKESVEQTVGSCHEMYVKIQFPISCMFVVV